MANTWGSLKWGEGNFGDQANVTEQVTGVQNNIALNSVDSYPNQGWGSDFWGSENWGESALDVTLTGQQQNITVAHGDVGFGQLAWSAYNTRWGGESSVNIAINQEINVSGQQLNISQASLVVDIAVEVFPSGLGLTTNLGSLDPAPDAEVTGQQLNTSLGSLTVYNEQGWGRDRWGTEVWGAEGIWASVQLTNTNLGLGVTSGIQETWGQDEWGASTTEWGGNSVTDVDIKTFAAVSGIELSLAEGVVDPSPDATVTGIGMTVGLGLGTVTANANTGILTGQQLNIAQGTAELDAVTFANVTGQQLNSSVGTAVAGASAEIDPTGIGLTLSVNSINVQSWQIVDTGSNVNWNIIDTAA